MDFYKEWSREKILTIEVDYSSIVRGLEKMNYDMRVYICNGDKIMLSNGSDNSVGKSIETFDQHHLIGYQQDLNLYGLGLKIYVLKSEVDVIDEITRNIPIVLFLVLVNIILPFILVWGLNHSFTVRIGELSKIFRKVDDDMLVKIDQVKGKDEISSLMYNYNKMVDKTNALIQTVYISKMKEQETTVARKNAEGSEERRVGKECVSTCITWW